ncbi:MAG: ABC transporter permease [Alphaproteobacteria bacterium]|nr:ABC transporter permease [Alphaproteobacteria bacterium]
MFANFSKNTLLRSYVVQCLAFLLLLGLSFSLSSPFFFSLSNFGNILTASAVIGVLAMGGTFVIASGGIDLSSAAIMALSSTACAYLLQNTSLPLPFILTATIATGGVCGFFTGLLLNITKAPSFIVTLGMMSIARAIAYIISNGVPIYDLPESLITTAQRTRMGVSVPVVLLLLGIMIAHILLTKTKFGAHTLILGDSEIAAEAMGVPTSHLRVKIYTLAGLYSGVAGLIFALRTNAGDPAAGLGYELVAITAIILGGASLFGGRATIFGTTLGFLCLGVLQNGLNLLAVSSYYQILFVGVVLLAASFLSRFGGRA